MDNFLDFAVPVLKFGAIFIGGISGIMALLVNFKTDDGKITKWGRIALIATVASFFISATMQAIEIHQDKVNVYKEVHKTNRLLNEISRSVYAIKEDEVSFNFDIEVSLSDPFFSKYTARLDRAIAYYYHHPHMAMPKETYYSLYTGKPDSGKIWSVQFTVHSPLYPNQSVERSIYEAIGEAGFDIKIKKFDTIRKKLQDTASLDFFTEIVHPQFFYEVRTKLLRMEIKANKPDADSYYWSNKGDIQALTDLAKARVYIGYSDNFLDGLNEQQTKMVNLGNIQIVDFNVASRKFACVEKCTSKEPHTPDYYFDLPADPLKTYLNIRCK